MGADDLTDLIRKVTVCSSVSISPNIIASSEEVGLFTDILLTHPEIKNIKNIYIINLNFIFQETERL